MKLRRTIYFWHGFSEKLAEKIKAMSHIELGTTSDVIYWTGSLDQFQVEYEGHFIVRDDLICVTQHSNFGQR